MFEPQGERVIIRSRPGSRAPDPAWIDLDRAGLGTGASLRRLDRPSGPVVVPAGAGLLLVVRINLLARERSMDRPDPGRLKTCVAPDYFVLAPAGGSARLAAHAAQAIVSLSIGAEVFARLNVGAEGCPLSPLQGRVLVDPVVTGLVEQLASPATGRDDALDASILNTLVLTLAAMARKQSRAARMGGLTARQLAALRAHVEARLDQPLKNADLAGVAGLSPAHFARAFKASMGVAPAGWIRLRRISLARTLLVETPRSVSDVAAAVGYANPSRFAAAFRETTGLTPHRYRRAQV